MGTFYNSINTVSLLVVYVADISVVQDLPTWHLEAFLCCKHKLKKPMLANNIMERHDITCNSQI